VILLKNGRWLGLTLLLLLVIQVITAEAEAGVEVPGGPAQTLKADATESGQLQPQAAQATSPDEDPPLRLPGWLADILGQTPEPQSVRLPAWVPRVLGAQATIINQGALPFHSPYRDANSFKANGDNEITQTYGIYLGAQLLGTPATPSLQAYLDAELFKGSGISSGGGLGGYTNGDVVRQGGVALPKDPYIARGYGRVTLPLALTTHAVERGMDHLAGAEPDRLLELKLGKFASNDDFDLNRYANSTRTQFMNWSLWQNTAWDYPADTRGYTNGVMIAWITPRWTARVGSYQVVTRANGFVFDEDVLRDHGDVAELTVQPGPWGTVLRVMAYANWSRASVYRDAVEQARLTGDTPAVNRGGRPGRVKYGVGLNLEQPLADDGETGLFMRFGWNDGRTASWMYTEVDQTLSAGAQISGVHWGRPADRLGVGYAIDWLSDDHRDYLAAGGQGFMLGDGRLTYGLERVVEIYYNWQLLRSVHVSPDYQFIQNPGYNRDRGPAHVIGGRLRVSF
jgi:high affinity Mn2+ porin